MLVLEIDAAYKSETIFNQPLLASTVRPDLIVSAMEARAQKPDFGVDYDCANYWGRFLVQRDNPDILRPFADEQEQQKRIHSFLLAEVEAKKQIVAELSAKQAERSARAKRITKLTIQNLNDDIAYAAKSKPSKND